MQMLRVNLRARVCLSGNNVAVRGKQQNVVKGKAFRDRFSDHSLFYMRGETPEPVGGAVNAG